MVALMGSFAVSGLAARNAAVSGSRVATMPTTTSAPARGFSVEAAHKKGTGSTKNGRDSNPQYLGVKKYGGEVVSTGNIIIRQRGNKVRPPRRPRARSDPPLRPTTHSQNPETLPTNGRRRAYRPARPRRARHPVRARASRTPSRRTADLRPSPSSDRPLRRD